MEKKKKIVLLLVDDDQPFLNLVEMHLGSKYEIITAVDGHDLFSKLEEHDPNLILLDIMMPKLDGFEACKSLKNSDKYRDIPVIMLTAKGTDKDIELGKKSGADYYVTKPFDFDELIDIIAKFSKNGG